MTNKLRSENIKGPEVFFFAISGSDTQTIGCQFPMQTPVSFCSFTWWLSLIVVSSQDESWESHTSSITSWPPILSHEECLCGSNDTAIICARGTGIRKLLWGRTIYCPLRGGESTTRRALGRLWHLSARLPGFPDSFPGHAVKWLQPVDAADAEPVRAQVENCFLMLEIFRIPALEIMFAAQLYLAMYWWYL